MPYLSCHGCRLKLYRATVSSPKRCPACGAELILHRSGRPDPSLSIFQERRPRGVSSSVSQLLELQKRISERIRGGGSLAQVAQEIIAPAALDGAQVAGLRRYARAQIRVAPPRGPTSVQAEGWAR